MARKYSFLILILFSIAFFGVRLSDYLSPLVGEEAIHANIFYTSPENPNYLLVGRINGIDYLGMPQHPALMYEMLGLLGTFWSYLVNPEILTIFGKTVLVRFAISTVQYFLFLSFLSVILFSNKVTPNRKFITALILILVSISVPVIKMSVSVQIDGSVGLFLSGVLALSLLIYWIKLFSVKVNLLLVFSASFIFGFGKNEWNIAIIVVIIISLLFMVFVSEKRLINNDKKSIYLLIGYLFLGVLIGNLVSYFFDPVNYLAGFNTMFRFAKASTFFNPRNALIRLPMGFVNLLMFCLLSIELLRSRMEFNFPLVFVFILSSLMFFPYMVISWGPDPRYFAPSLIIAASGLVMANKVYTDVTIKKLIIGFACVSMLLICINFYIGKNSMSGYNELVQNTTTSIEPVIFQGDCVKFINAGEAFGTKIDFLSNSLGIDDATGIANKFGKKLCQ